MPRYIDADALKELIDRGYDIDFDEVPETKKALLDMIDHQETADVIEIVSCKDCVFLELLDEEYYYAQCNWHGKLFPRFGNPDTRYYFCADCQRREDGTK